MDIKNFDLSIIYTRPDGSYVINQGLYHVPREGEWAGLWAEVDAYAKAHQEAVTDEPTPPEPTFERLKERKLIELISAFEARVSGSTDITVGETTYTMQFNRSDSLAVQGLIELMESTGQTTGYLTQADDTTVYDVPLEDIKQVLIGMLKAYAECHAKKQEYRTQINACSTKEELDEINFVF